MDPANTFHDHFSARAPGYARYRPVYPRALADYLRELVPGKNTALPVDQGSGQPPECVWEAGCGSGQLTLGLADQFDRVIATDASADQIAQAPAHSRVEYRVAPAHQSGLPDGSVDLAVAAQAAHWFDLPTYYQEVRRVVRPGGVLALVVYGLHTSADRAVDQLVMEFYGVTLRGFWPPQRKWVEDQYRTIWFPFEEISTPKFTMSADWNLDELIGYVESWSATGLLAKARGRNEIDAFRKMLASLWGSPETKRSIEWPLSLRAARIGD